jgi:hypothetical protein
MGVVYEAIDTRRGARVALKTLPRADPDAIYQLKQEFRSIAGIAHANLVTLHELHAAGDTWFITMDLVPGRNLREHLTGRAASGPEAPTETQTTEAPTAPVADEAVNARAGMTRLARPASDIARVRRVFAQLASGVAAIHVAGKLHRDLKPSNVLVTSSDDAIILDFGIAADLPGRGPALDLTEVYAGTPHYMAPEQFAAERLTEAADWYAVGVMLFEALTGRLPFGGRTIAALAHEKLTTDPDRPSVWCDGVPPDLDELCVRLLRRDPAGRPAGADVLRALRDVSAEAPGAGAPAGRIAPDAGVMVGREDVIAALQTSLDATADSPMAVFLFGRSGMGKSTVLRAFLDGAARDPRAIVLSGRCYEAESVPFKALDALMDSLARHLRRMPPAEVAAVLPRRADVLARMFPTLARVAAFADAPRGRPGKDAVEERLVAGAALRELLARLTDRARVVMAIDDVQWGDLDSAALLLELLAPPDAPPLFLCLAARSEQREAVASLAHLRQGIARQGVATRDLELTPLDADDVGRLHGALRPGERALAPERAARIAADAGGNPFLIREVLEAGATVEAGHEAVGAIVRDKVGALDAESRQLLEIVALSAKPLSIDQAARAAGLSRNGQLLVTDLRSARLLRSAGADDRDLVETYHDRIRETVAAQIGEDRLPACHAQIADVLRDAERPDPEHLAFHLEGARRAAEASALYVQAAAQASAALAFDHAVSLYERAFRLLPGEPEAALSARLAEALAEAGRSRDAADRFAEAAKRSNPATRRELTRRAAYYYCISGRIDEGKAALGEVLGQFGIGLPRSTGAAILAVILARARLKLRGWRFIERPADVLTSQERERLDSLWAAAIGLGNTEVISGIGFSARGLIQALDAGDPSRIVRAMCWEASLRAVDDVKTSAALIAEAERIATSCEMPYLRGMLLLARAILTINHNRWRDSIALFDEAEALWLEHCHGVDWELNTARHFCSWSLLYAGEFAECRRRLARYRREAFERGNLYVTVSMGAFAEPLAMMAGGDPAGARARRDEVMAQWTEQHFGVQHILAMLSVIQGHLYEGDGRQAFDAARLEHAAARKHGFDRLAVGRITTDYLTLNSVFMIAEHEGPQPELLKAAARALRRLEKETQPWGAASAHGGRAGLALLDGNSDEAARRLEQADAAFTALGMEAFAMAARRNRGAVIGGDRGRELVRDADTWLRDHGAADPEAYAHVLMYVPRPKAVA